jgi:prevent-host-death family protein
MIEVDVADAQADFEALLDQVEKGGRITITRYGRTIASVVPKKPAPSLERRREVIRRLREFGEGQILDMPIKDAINFGRR